MCSVAQNFRRALCHIFCCAFAGAFCSHVFSKSTCTDFGRGLDFDKYSADLKTKSADTIVGLFPSVTMTTSEDDESRRVPAGGQMRTTSLNLSVVMNLRRFRGEVSSSYKCFLLYRCNTTVITQHYISLVYVTPLKGKCTHVYSGRLALEKQ